MVDTLYEFPIPNADFPYYYDKPGNVRDAFLIELGKLAADGAVDQPGERLLINIALKDFKAKYPFIWGLAGNPNQKHVASFATQFLKNRDEQRRMDARDEFRQPAVQYPAADPTAAAGINSAMTKEAAATAMMAGAKKGFCLGYSHNDMDARGALYDLLDHPTDKPEILFIEEFPKELQADIDAYLASAPNAPMPKALRDHAKSQDKSDLPPNQNVPKGWVELLEKAKQNGIGLYGIDSVEADPGVDGLSALQPERRVAMMNKVAADVMKDVLARPGNANKKFIAGMGAAHANTHAGGIPGLSQIMDIPAAAYDSTTGGLAPLPEDAATRRMPSAAEQKFIEAYIESVEKSVRSGAQFVVDGKAVDLGADAGTFKDELYKSANELAKRLANGGKLPDANAVSAAMNEKMVTDQKTSFVDLLVAWPARATKPAATARLAISAGTSTLMRSVVDDHPALLQSTDINGKNLMHFAAENMQDGCIAELAIPLQTAGLLQTQLGARDKDGNTPLHSCVKDRRDKSGPRLKGQAAALDALITAGGDTDVTDATGRTPAHLAALNNNVDAMETLHGHGADFTKQDSRQWTPYDVAIGSTKVGIEQFFYANNIVANDPLVAPNETVNTVEALMRATKAEDPADLVAIRAAYDKLYAIKEIRPMLELVAADAMGKRDPVNGGGSRIFVANDNNTGKMYAHDGARAAAAGAYDEDSHVTMIAGKGSGDLAGRLAHEFTHAAARITFGDKQALPFTAGSQGETDYRDAIAKDVMETSRLVKSDPMESEVLDRMSGRMDSYTSGYPAQARLKLDQEYIVGVPQLMAQFGPDEVARLAPNLSGLFTGGFSQAVKQKTATLKADNTRGQINDGAIANLPAPTVRRPAPVPGDLNVVGTVVDVARSSYRADFGTPPAHGLLYSPTQMELPGTEQTALEARLQRVQKTMLRVVKEQGLPPNMAADAIRGLAIELNQSIKTSITNNTSLNDFDKSVAARASTWVRDTKLSYVRHCGDNNIQIPDPLLAEAVVIRAENIAWMTGAQPGDTADEHLGVDVDAKKHKAMAADLSKKLGSFNGSKADPWTLLTKLAAPIAGDKSNGFYNKAKNKNGKNADHVSIDEKSAKRTWMERLAAL